MDKISKLINHKLRYVVHKLLLVVLLGKTDAVDFVHFTVPEVAHHRCTSLLTLDDLQSLIFPALQL